jgi:hypothetical protein
MIFLPAFRIVCLIVSEVTFMQQKIDVSGMSRGNTLPVTGTIHLRALARHSRDYRAAAVDSPL